MKDYALSKRLFARDARRWWDNPHVTYRHVVPSAFASRMGWGPISADLAVTLAMFWIRRGFRYVPATVTGLAYLNYPRFRWQRIGAQRAASTN